MLDSLSVKNFALIRDANIDFKNNLNVLTGETGSGKSILIGSINLALGVRASRDAMRDEKEDTVVTISFTVEDKTLLDYIKSQDITVDDTHRIIIYRKITKDKNVVKINDEPVTLAKVRDITDRLIDIYGQHDSEDLRKDSRHIGFLDDFIGKTALDYKEKISSAYDKVKAAREKLESFNLDERMRLREIDILKYEVEELENANLKEGEEEELASNFKAISNSKYIVENLSQAISVLQDANVSKALKEVKEATKYDSSLENIYSSLMDCDSIVSDSIKELDRKLGKYDVDEKEFANMESRLDEIRSILNKYDNSVKKAMEEFDLKKNRLAELSDYDNEKKKAKSALDKELNSLDKICTELSDLRKKAAKEFTEKLITELKDLGFLDVKFEIDFKKKETATREGYDDVTFMISLNTGEKMRALSEVASGGELSRIMLSIKTILSNTEGTDTLIFDEIDAGISGITASKVAKKLCRIAKNHQVILITHLPQIACFADNHYVIRKEVRDDRTNTLIDSLDRDGMIKEIGRLISSSGELTDKVIANAKELKEEADKEKK